MSENALVPYIKPELAPKEEVAAPKKDFTSLRSMVDNELAKGFRLMYAGLVPADKLEGFVQRAIESAGTSKAPLLPPLPGETLSTYAARLEATNRQSMGSLEWMHDFEPTGQDKKEPQKTLPFGKPEVVSALDDKVRAGEIKQAIALSKLKVEVYRLNRDHNEKKNLNTTLDLFAKLRTGNVLEWDMIMARLTPEEQADLINRLDASEGVITSDK